MWSFVRREAARRQPVIVREYRGHQQKDTLRQYEAEARTFASYGYIASGQSWAQGQWGCGAFLVAVLLAFVLVGILILVYMLLVKPEGTLTVVYELRAAQPPAPSPRPEAPAVQSPAPAAGTRHTARLAALDNMRQNGLITEDEYEAKRREILREI